ncbi:MAG: SufE family protein [Bacteroidetes bacterium]|nr:SufE family protein [Bacteroidota bacterium]
MNPSMNEKADMLESDFAMFDSWEEKYEYLMDLGRDLHWPKNRAQTDNMLIRGCQSRVWLDHEMKDGKMVFYASSEALIVKGLVAMLLSLYSGRTPAEILAFKPDFIDRIGLSQHLSPTRSNGLLSMLNTIQRTAIALQNA